MFEVIGWLGSILFSMCAVPQAWQCWKQKHADGLSWTFLLMWLTGEILTAVYVWPTRQYPLLANYFFNGLCLLIILRYKRWPTVTPVVRYDVPSWEELFSKAESTAAGIEKLTTLQIWDNHNRETLRRK